VVAQHGGAGRIPRRERMNPESDGEEGGGGAGVRKGLIAMFRTKRLTAAMSFEELWANLKPIRGV